MSCTDEWRDCFVFASRHLQEMQAGWESRTGDFEDLWDLAISHGILKDASSIFYDVYYSIIQSFSIIQSLKLKFVLCFAKPAMHNDTRP